MTVPTTTNKVVYAGDGTTTIWPFSFTVLAATDISVYLTDTLGNITLLAPSLYTADLTNARITYPLSGSAIATGTKLTILRTVDYLQSVDWKNQGPFNAEVLEASEDKITMALQQLNESISRCVKYSVDQTPSDTTTNTIISSLNAAIAALNATQAMTYLTPTANSPANNKVAVAAGKFVKSDNSGTVTYAGGASPVFGPITTNPRIDLLCIDDTGTLTLVAGAENASPTPPTYPANKVVIAEVTVNQTSGVTISSGQIKDVRAILHYRGLPLIGGTMSGAIAMGGNAITGLANGVASGDAVNVSQLLSPNGTFIGLGRNRIINGDMVIDQQNEGASVTINASGANSIDQFLAYGVSPGIFTIQQLTSSPPTGFTHYVRITCSTADASIAAGDYYYLNHRIEGYNIRDFLLGTASAKTFTLSFWVRSSLTGTYTGAFQNNGTTRAYPFEYTINNANTWEQKTITLTGDITGTWLNTNGLGLHIVWALAIGSTYQSAANTWAAGAFYGTSNQVNFMSSNTSRTFDITGIQIEIGSAPTAFEFVPFPLALYRCQRYYEKTFPPGVAVAQNCGFQRSTIGYFVWVAGTSPLQTGAMWNFMATKRAAPTMTFYNPNAANSKWRNASAGADSGTSSTGFAGEQGALIQNIPVAGDNLGHAIIIHATADARL